MNRDAYRQQRDASPDQEQVDRRESWGKQLLFTIVGALLAAGPVFIVSHYDRKAARDNSQKPEDLQWWSLILRALW